jgi:hypothetical protein
LFDAHPGDIVHMVESCFSDWSLVIRSSLVDEIIVTDCLVQVVWYRLLHVLVQVDLIGFTVTV